MWHVFIRTLLYSFYKTHRVAGCLMYTALSTVDIVLYKYYYYLSFSGKHRAHCNWWPQYTVVWLWHNYSYETRLSLDKQTAVTLSLFSFRLTMTAVICWSMKMRIVARIAGSIVAGITQTGMSNGFTIQPRVGNVGWRQWHDDDNDNIKQHHEQVSGLCITFFSLVIITTIAAK